MAGGPEELLETCPLNFLPRPSCLSLLFRSVPASIFSSKKPGYRIGNEKGLMKLMGDPIFAIFP